MWAGVPAEREVFNLFSGAVRQQGLSRLEAAKQRQSLVPDLRIAAQPLAVAEAVVARRRPGRELGGAVEGGVLHEVKIISCNKTRYKPTWTKRAVDTRAEKLQQEYLVKAREADRVHNNTLAGTVGPVERKLVELGEVRGIVAGNFGGVGTDTLPPGLPGHQQSEGGGPLQGEERPPAERGGGKGYSHLCPETPARGPYRPVPEPVAPRALRSYGPGHGRCRGSALARRGAGAVLEKGAAGRQPGQAVGPHGLPVRICQDRISLCIVLSNPSQVVQIV